MKYTNTNGNDVLGLIAQGNVNVGMVSDDSFEIDGALMAENGRVGRFYYNSSCSVQSTNYSSRTISRHCSGYDRYCHTVWFCLYR